MLLVAVCCCFGGLRAQEAEGGVKFVEGKTFNEALAMAKESGKLLFVDCYTSWCGPCRMMATKVFPQKLIGDYFNEKFVSVKIDMEKGEGPDLHDRFNVRAYPTFLFLDGEGKVMHRIVGGDADAAKFLAKVKEGLGEKGLAAMTARYDGGERDTTFLMDYLEVLDGAYDAEKSAEVAEVLLKNRGADMLSNPRLYGAFLKYNTSPLSESFRYMFSHKDEFYARYGKEGLDRMMSAAWMSYPRNFITEATGDWKAYATNCSRYIKEYGAKDMYIYNWVLRIQKNCPDDAEVKATAVGWMKDRIAALEAEKAKLPPLKEGEIRAMPMMDFSKYYEKLIKDLEN